MACPQCVETLNLPVLALMDADPYGLKILSVYTSGSKNVSRRSSAIRAFPAGRSGVMVVVVVVWVGVWGYCSAMQSLCHAIAQRAPSDLPAINQSDCLAVGPPRCPLGILHFV